MKININLNLLELKNKVVKYFKDIHYKLNLDISNFEPSVMEEIIFKTEKEVETIRTSVQISQKEYISHRRFGSKTIEDRSKKMLIDDLLRNLDSNRYITITEEENRGVKTFVAEINIVRK